jgi:hypothetical protein
MLELNSVTGVIYASTASAVLLSTLSVLGAIDRTRRPRNDGMIDRREQLARAREARLTRSRGLGALLIAFGIFIWPTGYVVAAMLRIGGSATGHLIISGLVSGLISSLAAVVCGVLLIRGRRMRAKTAERTLETDARPPIVYLRPFDVDRVNFRAARYEGLALAFPFKQKTYEQRVAEALRHVGPFVALGDPTEELPTLGADRLYADDAEWQPIIKDWTKRAGAIFLHVGDSDGFSWEVQYVVGLGQPERIILGLGDLSTRGRCDVLDFDRKFGHVFPHGLTGGAGQFLYFDADWTCRSFPSSRKINAPPGSPGEQRALALLWLRAEFESK